MAVYLVKRQETRNKTSVFYDAPFTRLFSNISNRTKIVLNAYKIHLMGVNLTKKSPNLLVQIAVILGLYLTSKKCMYIFFSFIILRKKICFKFVFFWEKIIPLTDESEVAWLKEIILESRCENFQNKRLETEKSMLYWTNR